MSFKSKIIIRTFQFVLVLILVLLGIFAIYFVDNDNSIIPDVKNVNASLSATITGANETYNLEKLVYNGENLPSDQSIKTWENNNLTFKNTKEDIIISIVIENLSSENSLTVSVEDLSQEISNLSRIIKVENQENEYKSGDKIILEPSKGDEKSVLTFIIKLKITDRNYSINEAPYKFIIHLDNEIIESE